MFLLIYRKILRYIYFLYLYVVSISIGFMVCVAFLTHVLITIPYRLPCYLIESCKDIYLIIIKYPLYFFLIVLFALLIIVELRRDLKKYQ